MLACSPSVLDLQVTPKYLNYTSKVCICKEGIKLISLISKVDWIRTTLPLFLSVVLFTLLIVKGFNIFNLNWFPANLCYARQLMNCVLSWNTFLFSMISVNNVQTVCQSRQLMPYNTQKSLFDRITNIFKR